MSQNLEIDLTDLAQRESERVEWKENVADVESVAKTICAFANDYNNLGGGYIVCGAEETKDAQGFQAVRLNGMTSNRAAEIENHVLAHCRDRIKPPVAPMVAEIPTADPAKRILVFIVPATGRAHSYHPSGKDASVYYIRIGRETREARNGLLTELLVKRQEIQPWDRRACPEALIRDIDLIILRDYMQQMGLWDPQKGVEDYISTTTQLSPFVPPLAIGEGLTKTVRPRNVTMLMFGEQLTKFIPGAFAILSIYPGKDRSEPTAERTDVTGTVAEQAKRIIERLNIEASMAFDKESPTPNQAKYPRRALQEAVVNALVHRDYESSQPVRVTVFSDRIEIVSPGSLLRGVDLEKFRSGKAPPQWRNQSLAFFLGKLQLAQAEGQGIPTIIRVMKEEGCPAPIFDIAPESVTCVLPAHPRHQMMRVLKEIENEIILGNRTEAYNQLSSLLKSDPQNFRVIEMFCEVCNLLGKGKEVFRAIKDHSINLENFSASTQILVAETLLAGGNAEEKAPGRSLLEMASIGRLEATEVRKIAVGLRKTGDEEQVISFINEAMRRDKALAGNGVLLDIRGRAKIDLAKRCMNTAHDHNASPKIKGQAWDRCRDYLEDASRDLREALDVTFGFERDYVEESLRFLDKLEQIARKPDRRPTGPRPSSKAFHPRRPPRTDGRRP